MEVYIEYVILDNLIINYILLMLTSQTMKLCAKKSLCFLSSCFGTVVSIVLPLINFNLNNNLYNLILLILKIGLGMLMILIIKKFNNFKQYITSFFLFITYTFVLGGMCFGFIYLLNLKTSFSGLIIWGFEIPVGLFVLLGVLYLKILINIIKIVRHKQTYHKFYFDVTLKNESKKITITGFLDSGNQIMVNNCGIIVINLKTLLKLYPNVNYKNIITGSLNNIGLKNAEFINVVNSSGKNKMLVFTLDELEIVDDSNKVICLKNQKIGLAKTNFYGKFDCLLTPEIFVWKELLWKIF